MHNGLPACCLLLLSACVEGAPKDTADALHPSRVRFEAGSFTMGCEAEQRGCATDAQPAHEVRLSAYELGATELSVESYQACVDAGACRSPTGFGAGVDHALPVTGLHRSDAEAACAFLGGRLPTEAEWERAARGTEARTFPWGEEAPDCGRAWTRACGAPLVAAEADLDGATPEGARHLAGNAFEFVSDGYDPGYYEVSSKQDPTGPEADSVHTVRGTHTWADPMSLAAWRRLPAVQEADCPLCGVRCAWDLP